MLSKLKGSRNRCSRTPSVQGHVLRIRTTYCALACSLPFFDSILFAIDTGEELMETPSKLLYTLVQQLLCDLGIVDTDLLQRIQRVAGTCQIVLDAVAYTAMIGDLFDGL